MCTARATSAWQYPPGPGPRVPHLVPGLGSPRPQLHWDWAHPFPICAGTDWAHPGPHLHRDWAHPPRLQVDVFNAVYEPPDGIGGAPTSAAGLGVGAHPLAERGIVAKVRALSDRRIRGRYADATRTLRGRYADATRTLRGRYGYSSAG